MSFPIEPSLAAFLQSLPKTQTHLHIEGGFDFHALQNLRGDLFKKQPPSWDPHYRFPNFKSFEDMLLGMVFSYLKKPADYTAVSRPLFEQNLQDNVRYMEVSFASAVLEFLNFEPQDILEAIYQAVPEGLQVRVFMGIHHTGFGKTALPKLEKALACPLLFGIDLHGEESLPVDAHAPNFYAQARAAGKHLKAHAGEFEGPDFIYWVLDCLGVERIEHGIRSIEDKKLLKRLKNENITLDTCPISNLKLAPTATLTQHPCLALLDAGVPLTLSTDDPLIFGNRIAEEYAILHHTRPLSKAEMAQIARQGFQVALLDEPTRQQALQDIDALSPPTT